VVKQESDVEYIRSR